jgi:hypothetical protein
MRLSLLCAVSVALCACSANVNKIEEAEKRYALVKKHGSSLEICGAAREVARAYLEANDEDGYKFADVSADLDCNKHLLDTLE